MPEPRSRIVQIRMEESIYVLMEVEATKEGASISGYIRELVLTDLEARNKLERGMLYRILAGRDPTMVKAVVGASAKENNDGA